MFHFKDMRRKKEKIADVSADKDLDLESRDLKSIHNVKEEEEDSYSSNQLLSELYRQKSKYPEDINAAKALLPQIQAKVTDREKAIDSYENWLNKSSGGEDDEPPVSAQDASPELFISASRMTAFLCILPPIGDGDELEESMITSILDINKVTYGIDHEMVRRIAHGEIYNRIFTVARGTPAVHGIDGLVKERFSRKQEMHLEENEQGVIDHKNLNLYQSIHAGDVICDIVLPTNGQDGTDVLGSAVSAVKGEMPFIPKGEGTALNTEMTALLSEIDGDLAFVNGVFRVHPQLVIQHDVDGSTGHLDFDGDILIRGEVHNGFNVRAGGDIKVYGLVSGSQIVAGGDIILEKGANGGGRGSLTAEGNITAQFLEQINIHAAGDVHCDTVINCNIACGGTINVTARKGIIIGGTLAATESVEAKRIGNLSNIKTVIKIGSALQTEENIEHLEVQLKESRDTHEKIKKNVEFLKKLPSIPTDKQELYLTLKEQESLYANLIDEQFAKLEELYRYTPDYSLCHVKAEVIYGITEVSLNRSSIIVRDSTSKVNIYYDDGELTLGTF